MCLTDSGKRERSQTDDVGLQPEVNNRIGDSAGSTQIVSSVSEAATCVVQCRITVEATGCRRAGVGAACRVMDGAVKLILFACHSCDLGAREGDLLESAIEQRAFLRPSATRRINKLASRNNCEARGNGKW